MIEIDFNRTPIKEYFAIKIRREVHDPCRNHGFVPAGIHDLGRDISVIPAAGAIGIRRSLGHLTRGQEENNGQESVD